MTLSSVVCTISLPTLTKLWTAFDTARTGLPKSGMACPASPSSWMITRRDTCNYKKEFFISLSTVESGLKGEWTPILDTILTYALTIFQELQVPSPKPIPAESALKWPISELFYNMIKHAKLPRYVLIVLKIGLHSPLDPITTELSDNASELDYRL